MNRYRFGKVLVMIGLLALVGCAAPEETESPIESEAADDAVLAPEIVEVETGALDGLGLTYEVADVRDFTPTLELPAEIVPVPDRQALVTPQAPGRLVAVLVNEGDEVRRGDVLAYVSSTAVGEARAQVIAATARVDVARKAVERAANLRTERVGSARAVEEAQAALDVSEAELQAAVTRLRTYGADPENDDDGDPARVSILAPFSGTVVARNASVGQWVDTADALFETVRLETLWVLAMVYEREMRHVEVGQNVQIQVRAFPGETFSGQVDRVADQLDEATRTVRVRVVIQNESRRLRPGMFATARIEGTHAHEARRLLTISWSAVQEVDGHHIVFVHLGDGRFEPRRIHTGDRSAELVEILSGLQAGDEIVVDGSVLLKAQLLRSTLGEEE